MDPLFVYSFFEYEHSLMCHGVILTTPLPVYSLLECEHALMQHNVLDIQQFFPFFCYISESFLFIKLYIYLFLLLVM